MTPDLLAPCALGLTGAWAIRSDTAQRRLPNSLCLTVALLGSAFALWSGGWPLLGSVLLHALAALMVGMALFAARVVGGGDAKYYAAVATWFSLHQALALLFNVSIAGLVLFAGWFAWRRMRGIKVARAAQADADKFPYGVAIAIGAIALKLASGTL